MFRAGLPRSVTAAIAAAGLALTALAAPATAAPTWLEPQTLSGPSQDADVAANGRGVAAVIWTQPAGPGGELETVYVATHAPGGGWSAPEEIADPTVAERVEGVNIGVDAQGGLVAAWAQGGFGDQELQLRLAARPAGSAWTAPVPASDDVAEAPQLVVDPSGRATVSWQTGISGARGLKALTRQPDGAVTPTVPPLEGMGGGSIVHALAADPGGRAGVIWVRRTGGDRSGQARVRLRDAAGTFEPGRPLGGADSDGVDLAFGPDGEAIALWTERTGGGDSDIRSARRGAGEADFAAPVNAATDAPGVLGQPLLAIAPDGTALAVWIQQGAGGLELFFSSAPKGGDWSAPAAVPDLGNVSVQDLVALDGGRFALLRSGAEAIGLNATVLTAGAGWSPPAPVTADPIPDGARLGRDDHGNAVAAWPGPGGTRAAAYDAAGPLLEGLAVPASGAVGASLPFAVAPVDAWSAVRSTSWLFGDGGTAAGGSVAHTYGRSGAFAVTVGAVDAVGNESSATRTVNVGPGGSGGGGSGGVLGDTAGSLPTILFNYTFDYRRSRTRTRVRILTLTGVPTGARVEVRCRGRGCPFRRRRPTVTRRMRLHRLFTRSLRAGVTIQVIVSRPGMNSRILVIRTRSRRGPSLLERCAAPGQTVLRICPF